MNSNLDKLLGIAADIIFFIACLGIMTCIFSCGHRIKLDPLNPQAATDLSILVKPANDTSVELVDKLIEDFGVARHKLLTCGYFSKKYPEQYKKLYTLKRVSFVATYETHKNYCGLGFSDLQTVVLFKEALDEDPMCETNLFITVAHELLHIVDMPKHKMYDTKEEYFEEDPIEQVIFWCVRPVEGDEYWEQYSGVGLR